MLWQTVPNWRRLDNLRTVTHAMVGDDVPVVHWRTLVAAIMTLAAALVGCADPDRAPEKNQSVDLSGITGEIEQAVWAFHAADTTMDAEAVIGLLWPDYTMLADGNRIGYDDVVAGSQEFMGSLRLFHTDWTDVQITPLSLDVAVASFTFRDSIITTAGELIRARGPTTFVWQRRDDEWRLIFADADHYPIEQ